MLNIDKLKLDDDECKFLLMKVVEQAVRDFLSLEASSAPIEKFHYSTAKSFLFDESYTIDYGDHELTIDDVLSILDIEKEWFRSRVNKLRDMRVRSISLKLRDKRK